MLPIARIREAQDVIARHLPRTPLVPSPALSLLLGTRIFLKLETCSPVGSFKARGAFFAISEWLKTINKASRHSRPRLVTASSGNHGLAVAYASGILGVDAAVYVPENASATKTEAIRQHGVALVRAGKDVDEAKAQARDYAVEGGGWWLEDGREPNVAIGAGTIGAEIVEDLPEADEIIVPVGNGALIGGVGSAARALSPEIEVTGVQPEKAPAMARSYHARKPVNTDACDTIADGLAARVAIPEAVELMCEVVTNMIEVTEVSIRRAVRALADQAHVLVEPAAAAALAGAIERREQLVGKNAVLVLTGANIDRAVLLQCLQSD